MAQIWTILLLFSAFCIELGMSCSGIPCPVIQLTCLYLSGGHFLRQMIPSFICVIMLDAALGRTLPLSFFSLSVTWGVTVIWKRYGTNITVPAQMLPAAIICLSNYLLFSLYAGYVGLLPLFAHGISVLLYPFLQFILDFLAFRIRIPTYRETHDAR